MYFGALKRAKVHLIFFLQALKRQSDVHLIFFYKPLCIVKHLAVERAKESLVIFNFSTSSEEKP